MNGVADCSVLTGQANTTATARSEQTTRLTASDLAQRLHYGSDLFHLVWPRQRRVSHGICDGPDERLLDVQSRMAGGLENPGIDERPGGPVAGLVGERDERPQWQPAVPDIPTARRCVCSALPCKVYEDLRFRLRREARNETNGRYFQLHWLGRSWRAGRRLPL